MIYADKDGNITEIDSGQDKLLRCLYTSTWGRMILKPLVSPVVTKLGGFLLNRGISSFMIPSFVEKNNINMKEYEPEVFRSYNEFFKRKIKSKYRPICQDKQQFISPCDGKLSVYPIDQKQTFSIKHTEYTVESLLRSKKLAKYYEGGTICVFRLTVDDYHRFCYVADGRKTRNYTIPGVFHTVNPIANDVRPIYKENTREFCLLKTKEFGVITVMEVGALMVGKITNYHQEATVKRGQEKGCFEFGGSTIIVLLKKGQVALDSHIWSHSKKGCETIVKMGEKIGCKTGKVVQKIMDNKELFHMRELTMKDLEQYNDLLRYAFQVTGDDLLKTGWQEDEFKHGKAPILEKAYVLGWFYEHSLASQIVVYPMEVNIYGEIYTMGGITGVTTYPEYAGRGLVQSLMVKILEYMRAEKQFISFLYPYSIPFYRKKGWEVVSDKLTYVIKDIQLPQRKEVPGIVRRVDVDHEDLKKVYKYYAVQHHGALIRDELAWDEYFRWETDDVTIAIYYDEDGKPLGSLVYAVVNEIFHVKEMIYLNLEAKNGLWNYIGSHYSMITEVRGKNYTGEPLAFLLEDSEITETIEPYFMARIVDVKEFILQYPFLNMPEDLHIHIRVHDEMAPWNEGLFEIYWKEEETYCEKVEEETTMNLVELDIQTLTTMLMGYKRPTYLYENDRLQMEYYMNRVLEQLIPIGKPYFSDYF